MARRRINKRALLIVAGTVILMIGAIAGLWQGKWRYRDPLPYLEKGDLFFEQGQYEEAAFQYSRADSFAGRAEDTATQAIALVKLSKVLPHLETEQAVGQAMSALNRAVSKDPASIDVRRERLELQYEMTRESNWLAGWESIREYADDLIERDPENARAHYLAGVATLTAAQIRQESPSNMLQNRREALQYFQTACKYAPESAEYCKVLTQTYVSISGLISTMRVPLPLEDRQLVVDNWYKADHHIRQFLNSNPRSGAAMVLLADVLSLPRTLALRDHFAQVGQQAQISGLTDQELLEAYLEAYRQDLDRPTLTAVVAAIERLMYREDPPGGYLHAAQEFDTDRLEVQLAVATYWLSPARRNLGKAVVALQKAVEYEPDIIVKLRLYRTIAETCSEDAQRQRALEVCNEALAELVDLKILTEPLAKSVNLRIVRGRALAAAIFRIHLFAARTLQGFAGQVRETDPESDQRVNDWLDSAEKHLEAGNAIIEARTAGAETMIVRGAIALNRRPRSGGNIRDAIRLYEQAREQIDNIGLRVDRRSVTQYVNLHVTLAQAYGLDGQSGAAEETLTKAIETIRELSPASLPAINPRVMLYLITLQLNNRRLAEAEQGILALLKQISDSKNLSEQEQRDLTARTLMLQVRQYVLQDKTQTALRIAQNIEQHFPDHAVQALATQVQILERQPDSEAEMEALLKRWITMRPDSWMPLARLADVYLQQGHREKAITLLKDAQAQNPKLQEFLAPVIAVAQTEGHEQRLELQKKRIQDITDPLQRQLSLYRLHERSNRYYRQQAAEYKRDGKIELAEKAEELATRNSEQALQALEQAYQIEPDRPDVYEPLLVTYLRRSDWGGAQTLINRAKQKNWDGVQGLYFLGRLHNRKGEVLRTEDREAAKQQYQKALGYLDQAVLDRPTFYQAWAQKAGTETRLGRHEEALVSARMAHKQSPNSILAVQALLETMTNQWLRAAAADDLVTAERYAKTAYQLARRALRLQPNHSQAELLRLAYLDSFDPDAAIRERLTTLKQEPLNRENLLALIRVYQRQHQTEEIKQLLIGVFEQQPDLPGLVILLARLYNQDKQYDQALQQLLSARQRWPGQLEIVALLAQTHRLKNQPQKAVACLQEFLSTAPDESKWLAYQTLGVVQRELARPDEAAEAFRKAMDILKKNQPENTRAICNLAKMMLSVNAQREALDTVLPLAKADNQYAIQTLVQLYRLTAQAEPAVKWAQRGADLAPESSQASTILAEALMVAGKPDHAQQILQDTIDRHRSDITSLVTPYVTLADALIQQRQYESAARLLQDAIASGVNHPQVRMKLAALRYFQGRFDDASQQYYLVLQKHSGNMEARKALANSLIRQKRYSQAETALDEGRRVQPDQYDWPQLLSALWANRDDDQPIRLRFDNALKFALEANSKAGNALDTLVGVMTILNARGEYERCIDFYEKEVPEKHKHDYRISFFLARAEVGTWQREKSPPPGYLRRMTAAQLELLESRVIARIREVLDESGEDPQYHAPALQHLVNIRGLDNVIQSAKDALSANPQDPRSRVFLAQLLNRRASQRLRKNEISLADQDLNQVVNLLQSLSAQPELTVPLRLRIYSQLANAYTFLQNFEQAKDVYLNIVRLRPNDFWALNNLAYLLSDTLNRPDEALPFIERALPQNPKEYNLLDTYGWTLYKAGQVGRAIVELGRSVDIRPTAMSCYHLGVVLKEAGESKLALQKLRQAATLLENDPVSQEQIGSQLRMLIEVLERE